MGAQVKTPPPPLDPASGDFGQLLSASGQHLPELQGPEYSLLHYDDLRYRELPTGLTLDEAWHLIKFQRLTHYRPLALVSVGVEPLVYRLPPQIEEVVHKIDSLGGQWFESRPEDHEEGRRFVRSALIEEAIASSLIEGVATTRDVAKELLRSGRAPRNDAERAVVSNLLAMEFVLEHQEEPLSVEFIRRLHSVLADGWLAPEQCGTLRTTDDIVVWDPATGEVLHQPPPHDRLSARLESLCDFANEQQSSFLHPLVRAAALHFMLAYEHPFHDGNGRMARALFHWSMLSQGYRMYEFLPVSRRILKAASGYPRAFRLVETDQFDLTYFLAFLFKSVKDTLEEAHAYLTDKRAEHERFVKRVKRLSEFNYRQQAVLVRALDKKKVQFTARSHANSHGVTTPTARTDLAALEKAGLLRYWRDGRKGFWEPDPALKDRLANRM